MAESRPGLDMEQILREAHRRWLRPDEICEILQNYNIFGIAQEPANMPSSGSFFLFDRKVLRYFRNDGHNWRKKKDGKTVQEGHERLKVGSIEVLHCYYARGQGNENFRRRSYWMLKGKLSHIALVHYREVEIEQETKLVMDSHHTIYHGNRTDFNRITETEEAVPLSLEAQDILPNSEMDISVPLQTTHIIDSARVSEYEDAEPGSAREDVLGNGTFGSQELGRHPETSEDSSFMQWVNELLADFPESPMQSSSGDYGLGPSLSPYQLFRNTDLPPNLAYEGLEVETSEDSSFSQWVNELLADSRCNNVENGVDGPSISPLVHLDNVLDPSFYQDRLFNIIDFSPNWAYEDSEIKVVITGTFLMNQQARNYKWSCMFGDLEVPAEVVADGVLHCHTPAQKAAWVPFSVTFSNRLACSQVRQFEYRVSNIHTRFGKLLCVSSACPPSSDSTSVSVKSLLRSRIKSLLMEHNSEWDQILELSNEKLREKLLKQKLRVWLLQKVDEGGKGPSELDEGGQGVLHYAAALDYDWALEPTIVAGVNVDFRDVNGWTALHWAAFYGRECAVKTLVSLGAAPGALTEPCPKFTSGRTPAHLAGANGHKGIAGYLAESYSGAHLSSSAHLSYHNLDAKEGDDAQIFGAKAVQTISERTATPVSHGDLLHVSSESHQKWKTQKAKYQKDKTQKHKKKRKRKRKKKKKSKQMIK